MLKHAGPTAVVTVVLIETAEALELRVEDDGPGFDATAASDGAGLVNMEDRVGSAGGTVRIESAPGDGTRVIASVPLA